MQAEFLFLMFSFFPFFEHTYDAAATPLQSDATRRAVAATPWRAAVTDAMPLFRFRRRC
jgi:hypothetical protein